MIDIETGRCGAPAPRVAGSAGFVVCAIRAGHAGWHRGDDGSEWNRADDWRDGVQLATAPEPRVEATEWTVTAMPDDHPDAYLFKLLIEPVRRGDGVQLWRVKRRLGPDRLCRRNPDPRGIEECKHGCLWDTWDEAIEFAKKLAPTLAVLNGWVEDGTSPTYIDVARAIEMGQLP